MFVYIYIFYKSALESGAAHLDSWVCQKPCINSRVLPDARRDAQTRHTLGRAKCTNQIKIAKDASILKATVLERLRARTLLCIRLSAGHGNRHVGCPGFKTKTAPEILVKVD